MGSSRVSSPPVFLAVMALIGAVIGGSIVAAVASHLIPSPPTHSAATIDSGPHFDSAAFLRDVRESIGVNSGFGRHGPVSPQNLAGSRISIEGTAYNPTEHSLIVYLVVSGSYADGPYISTCDETTSSVWFCAVPQASDGWSFTKALP